MLTANRSAASTVDIFRSLVSNHEEVDVEKAVSAGSLVDAFLNTSASKSSTSASASGAPVPTSHAHRGIGDRGGGGEGGSIEDEQEQAGGPSGYYDEVLPVSNNSSSSSSKQNAISGSSATRVGEVTAAASEDSARTSAREILLTLPGINVHNFREVLNNVNCLADLSAMTEQQLLPLIGPINAKKLCAFFTQSS